MNLLEIQDMPTVIDNIHQSAYRTSGILNQVLQMIDRGDSSETIKEVVDLLMRDVKSVERVKFNAIKNEV